MASSSRSSSPLSATTALTEDLVSNATEGRTISFVSIDDFRTQLSNLPAATDDTILITGVSPIEFEAIDNLRTKGLAHYRLRLYDPATGSLIITMITHPHEYMAGTMDKTIFINLFQMGLAKEWTHIGTTTFTNAHSGTKGEADAAGAPQDRCDIIPWPTLIIESGVNSTLSELRTKMRWWFGTSQDHVKLVILTKLNKNTHRITIEMYRTTIPERPGATTTRQPGQPQPTLLQRVTITRDASDYTVQHVEGGPLVAPFELVMDRAPTQGEHDIIVSNEDLEDYARSTWRRV